MRRLLLLLLGLAACSEERGAQAPAPATAVAPAERTRDAGESALATRAEAEHRLEEAKQGAGTPAPARTLTPTSPHAAIRGYEQLLNGRRAATMRVRWTPIERDGKRLVEDVTEVRAATDRDMAGMKDRFTSKTVSTTLRTEEGELLEQETRVEMPGRTDVVRIARTDAGYRITHLVGVPESGAGERPNEESFEIPSGKHVMVDAEAFLGPKIRAGEATPGATFPLPLLDAGRRRVVEATLRVVGPDDEGPGLKVVESLEGQDSLWWFAEDGAVVRLRQGTTVTRRDDAIRLEDLPRRAASYRITLDSNVDLPRLFTARKMLVDMGVRTDETVKVPKIQDTPFTEVVERADGRLTVLLKSHDDPAATCPLPIDPKGFEEYLKATPLMEVDDPEIRELARDVVGEATDAREAARRIADRVFQLRKGSPSLAEPTAKQILAEGTGDCSEHSLLFTTLCRAAGIPARRCSGWVCVGDDWGGHGWCEIWVGKWIGADPTTNEIGTRARYILLSRPDEHDFEPGFITAERTALRIRRAEWADGAIEIGADGPETDMVLFTGIRLGPLPEGWRSMYYRGGVLITAADFTITAAIAPDQGYRSPEMLVQRMPRAVAGAFGGRPAVRGRRTPSWLVSLGREILAIHVETDSPESVPSEETLAKIFAPTLERGD
jgi:hypothetical protein